MTLPTEQHQGEPPIRFPTGQRIAELDGLRGIAIFLVLLFHFVALTAKSQPGSLTAHVIRVLGLGWSGVDLFFVLSGFLIGGILIDQRASPSYFRTFYKRRVCRIFPLYYAVILVYAVPIWFGVQQYAATLYEVDHLPVWQYALYVQNVGMAMQNAMDSPFVLVTWSLAVEEQFYLLLPLIVRFVPPRSLLPLCLVFVVSSPVLRMLLFEPLPGRAYRTYLLLPCRWDALFLGVAVAILVRHRATAALIVHRIRWLYLAWGALGVLIAILAAKSPNALTEHMAGPGFTAIALFYLVMLLIALHTPVRWIRRAIRARWLRWLGDVSYATYMLHFPVLMLAHWWAYGEPPKSTDGLSAAVTLAALIATLGLAWLSTNTFERYFIQLGRRRGYEPAPVQG